MPQFRVSVLDQYRAPGLVVFLCFFGLGKISVIWASLGQMHEYLQSITSSS